MKIKKYKQFLESKSDNMWDIIPESVKDLQLLFKSKGKKLYVVGGAVRDFLTGDTPKDFDLATDALPDEVLEILGNKYKTNLQGKAFGVVVVFTNDQPMGMEIATFRIPQEHDLELKRIEQTIMRNRRRGQVIEGRERITSNTVVRALLANFIDRVGEMDLTHIDNEEMLKERMEKVFKQRYTKRN